MASQRSPAPDEETHEDDSYNIPSRTFLNKSLAATAGTQKVEGTGHIQVDVRAPKGTGVKASAGGMFKTVRMQRGALMQPALDYSEE